MLFEREVLVQYKVSDWRESRLVLGLSVLCAVVVLVGCAPLAVYVPVTFGSYGSPRDPASVIVYTEGHEPNRAYEVMGKVSVAPNMTSKGYNANFSPEQCFAEMQRQAASRGGDAVIKVQYFSETSNVSEFGASGGGGSFGAYGYSGPQTVSKYEGYVVRWKN
jgi:hypothetical protein